jgi:hypothetical protein
VPRSEAIEQAAKTCEVDAKLVKTAIEKGRGSLKRARTRAKR